MMDWLKVNAIDSDKQNLKKKKKKKKKIGDVDKNIPDTSKFIVTQDLNRLKR